MGTDTLVADLIAAGVDPVLVARVRHVIEQLERRKQRDRERQQRRYERRKQPHVTSCEPSREPSREPDVRTEPLPKFPWPADHREQFWAAYPNKVGKRAALTALERVRKLDVPWATLMAGLSRYVGKTDDRPWCHPTTWLNQDRWTDEPAEVAQRFAGRPPRPGSLEHQREETYRVKQQLQDFIDRNNADGRRAGGRDDQADDGGISIFKRA